MIPTDKEGRVKLFAFGMIATLLIAFGGASRPDVPAHVIIRLLALGGFVWALNWPSWEVQPRTSAPLILLGTLAVVMALQLVPLPPGIWAAIPARDLVVRIDEAAGLTGHWRALSLLPDATLNSLLALLVPGAAMVLFLRTPAAGWFAIAALLCVLILVSCLVGLFQISGSQGLYFYEITNRGSPVGLFSNRNHNALFLALAPPLLAVLCLYARDRGGRRTLVGPLVTAFGLLCLTSILVAGSRIGLALFAVSSLFALALYRFSEPLTSWRRSAKPSKHKPLPFGKWAEYSTSMLTAGAMAILAVLFLIFSRRNLIGLDRVGNTALSEEGRIALFEPLARLAFEYMPFGTGFGTFAPVYKIHEPSGGLTLAYLNHAHNDVIEVLIEGGAPALVLSVLLIGFWVRCSWMVWKTGHERASRQLIFGRLGSILMLILMLGSITDYPLRTPALGFVFAVAFMWLWHAAMARPGRGVDGAAPID